MLYLAFSKLNLLPLSIIGLFLLIRVRSFLFWFLSGFAFFLSSLFWVRISMIDYGGVYPPLAYLLVMVLALFLTLYQYAGTYILWKLSRFFVPLLPFIWTALELLRSSFPYGGFPWLLMGETLLGIPILKNYLSAGGVYLGSALTLSLATLPLILRKPRQLIIYLIVFIIPVPFIKFPRNELELSGLKIAIFQTNVPEHIKLNKPEFYRFLPSYWRHFERIRDHKPDILFLPESAFPFDARDIYAEGQRLLGYSKDFTIVTGLTDMRASTGGYEAYNSVFVLEEGQIRDFYDKVKILPFGEFVPFPFRFVKKYFGAIGGVDFSPGKEVRCVRTRKVTIGTPICFEVSYYSLVKKMAECSDLIAVVTNDAWFRDSDGTFQHLRQARVRAVETRKYILWINNTGPSAVISPEGEIIRMIPYGKQDFIIYTFN